MEREYQENLAKNKGKRWASLEGLVTGMVMISLVPITPICTIAVDSCTVHVSPSLSPYFRNLLKGNKREGDDDGKGAGGNDDSGSSLICATEEREGKIYIAT